MVFFEYICPFFHINFVSTAIFYFIFINLVGGILFAYDKHAAKNDLRRVSELTLHLLEILGGVFVVFLLMCVLRHKNRKINYWFWTWFALIGWLTGIIYFIAL